MNDFDLEKHFSEIISPLNRRNSVNLWKISSVLSALDHLPRVFANNHSRLYPLLHPVVIHALGLATLHSKAMAYKQQDLSSDDWKKLREKLGAITADDNFLIGTKEEPNASIWLRHISALKDRQFSLSRFDFVRRVERSFSLYFDLPTKHQTELKSRLGKDFLDIPSTFENETGLSFFEAVQVGLYWFAYGRENIVMPCEKKMFLAGTEKGLQLLFLEALISDANALGNAIMYSPPSHQLFPQKELQIQKFVELLARDERTLREMLDAYPYNQGSIAYRVSPLERYPIVKVEHAGGAQYFVPNFSYLDNLVPELPNFVLQDSHSSFRGRYHATRGVLQEYHLKAYVETSLQAVYALPESEYRAPGGSWHGPDLTLVDQATKRLILVESKGTRLRAETMASPEYDDLLENIKDATKALSKLGQKFAHIKLGKNTFNEFPGEMSDYLTNDPIYVVVIGGAGHHFSEKVSYAMENADVSKNVRSFPHACIMDVELFERAVDVAASEHEPLSNVLIEYCKAVSRRPSITESYPEAETFGGKWRYPQWRRKRTLDRIFDGWIPPESSKNA